MTTDKRRAEQWRNWGEPWVGVTRPHTTRIKIEANAGDGPDVGSVEPQFEGRILNCINALRGIPEPEKFVEAFNRMKDAIEESHSALGCGISDGDSCTNCEALDLANLATGSEGGKEKP